MRLGGLAKVSRRREKKIKPIECARAEWDSDWYVSRLVPAGGCPPPSRCGLVGWLVGSVGIGAAERDPQRWDADGPLIGQVLLRERFFPTLCFLLFFAPTSWYLVHFRTVMEQNRPIADGALLCFTCTTKCPWTEIGSYCRT